jgi:catechol 2,3-dioxygenase-like lactoylglutathione lyase family enzyme
MKNNSCDLSRRHVIHVLGTAAAALPLLNASPVWAAGSEKSLLPLNTPKIDHLDVMVPNVENATRFYMSVFKTSLHAQPFQGGQRYFVLLGDLPENRQVGYLAVGDSRGRGTYIGHFCTSVFNYRENAAALMQQMTDSFEKAGFGNIASVSRGGPAGIFSDPDGIELQFLPAPDTLITAAVPSQLVEWNQGMLTPKGVDHVLLKVSNMKKAQEFYRTLYGKKDVRDRKTGRVWFPIGDTRLGLEETKYQFGDKPRIAHFCIKVAPFDRASVTAGLRKLGSEVLPSEDDPEVLRFKDLDGITVEVRAV